MVGTILFLPFILFESVISGVARSLNLPPPPQFFGQFNQEQRTLSLPSPPKIPEFPKPFGSEYLNTEEWSWVDYKGRERKLTVKRHAKEK